MSSQDNNLWKYALIGTGALVGAAAMFHLMSSSSGVNKQCLKEVDDLGPVKRDPNGMINFTFYKDIFLIISKYAKQKFANEKKKLLEQRR